MATIEALEVGGAGRSIVRNASITPGWTWRERTGARVSPADMHTRHLFYTLRMIWNHAMPAHMAVGRNIKRYVFGSFYTAEYMREAILNVGNELFSRSDAAPWMLAELDQIREWLGVRQKLLARTPEEKTKGGPG